jgi:UDP-3-O-[3-hydroxymyristoyl] glucosamine N-acyltransferase
MNARSFFRSEPITIDEIAKLTGAELRRGPTINRRIEGIAALDRAGPSDLVLLAHRKFAAQARDCVAGACLTSEPLAEHLSESTATLVTKEPFRAFVAVARALYPDSLRPSSLLTRPGVAPDASVHPSVRLENAVAIDPGAVIGPGVEIGSGTVIGANAVIGRDVRIGRDCSVGPNCSIAHTLMGDRVIIHPGCAIGQDGFGFLPGANGHRKVPQIGRVIIQDDVELGANVTIDRGATRDTVIGEGTKIDNLVQIAHNVTIGRHCLLAGQTGIAGSVVVEDGVMIGGQVAVSDHVTIGAGAALGGQAGVMHNIPAGERWGGLPARPAKQWLREVATLERLARYRHRGASTDDEEEEGK